MFSNVKKYSKNYKFKKVRNSNDQTLSSFGTFQTPLPLWKYEEVSNTCSIYTTQQLHCSGNYALLSVLQWAGCLPSTKSTHHHNLLLLLHNWSAFVRWMCAYAHLHTCALQIVQSTQSMCFSRLCIAQLCKRRLCASVCDLITREDLDHPDTIFASACAVAGADVYTCSGSSAVKAVPGQISSGKGSFACTFSCTFWSKKDAK